MSEVGEPYLNINHFHPIPSLENSPPSNHTPSTCGIFQLLYQYQLMSYHTPSWTPSRDPRQPFIHSTANIHYQLLPTTITNNHYQHPSPFNLAIPHSSLQRVAIRVRNISDQKCSRTSQRPTVTMSVRHNVRSSQRTSVTTSVRNDVRLWQCPSVTMYVHHAIRKLKNQVPKIFERREICWKWFLKTHEDSCKQDTKWFLKTHKDSCKQNIKKTAATSATTGTTQPPLLPPLLTLQ